MSAPEPSSYGVYYYYPDEEGREFVESFSDYKDALAERDKLQAAIDGDEDYEGAVVKVVPE